MKRTLLLLLATLVLTSTAWSKSKINPAGRIMLSKYKIERQELKSGKNLNNSNRQSDPQISAIIVLDKDCDATILEGLNVEILTDLTNVLVIRCPISVIEQIEHIDQVRSIEFDVKITPMLNFARPSGTVSDVQNGFTYDGSTMSFDGSGVVCGMMDTGLEANHLNFKNADGSSRIQRLWHMNSNNGNYTEYNSSNISSFTTDNTGQSHATHVGGIIGGSYKGNGNYFLVSSASANSGAMKTNQPIPFYGVSTGADLAFAVGELYTPNIIQGVTKIIEYAESQGQPAVINLSLGHTVGPHDGSDAYCQALSSLGKRAIICMSAGNDGDELISINKTLAASGNNAYLRTFPVSATNNNNLENGLYTIGYTNGVVDLWTDSSQPVTVSWKLYKGDASTAETIISLDNAGEATTSGNSVFSNNFAGSISMTADVDPNNNRYNVYSSVAAQRLSTNTTGVLMLEVTGAEGTKIYLYGSSVGFSNNNGSSTPVEFTKGSAANSINDGCCADNILSVGAYTSRIYWGCLDNRVYSYTSHSNVGLIAPFSSYGTTYQGKNLPLVSGPGTSIISSYNRYYSALNANSMTASAVNGSATDYWGAMQGTSMSCPFVTGTIGLWLQADPTLTFDRVLDVINATSTYKVKPNIALPGAEYNGTAADKVKWGAGMINGLEGIKEVLAKKAAAIGDVWADDNHRLVLTPTAGGYDVFVAGTEQLTVTLYDLQGRPVASTSASADNLSISTATLIPGVYILEARTPTLRLTRKVTR